MKTLLIGAGAIGGTIGVLTRNAGYDVSILCINEAVKNDLEKNGISLHGAKGEYNEKFTCYSSPADIGDQKFDVCIIATKYSALIPVAKSILPFLKEDSLVVGMQNGLCTDELAEVVGKKRAVGCMLGFGATRNSDTDVTMTSLGEMYIGMPDGYHPEALEKLCEMLGKVLPTQISDNITRQQYSKLIINSCINATAAITGKTLGVVIDDVRAGKLFLAITREGMHVAKAMGINVPKYGKLLEYRLLMLMDNAPYNALCRFIVKLVAKLKYADVKPSTLQSLERGELTEMIHEIERGERKITPDNLAEFKGVLFK